jgi:hypothetical protein
MAKRERAANTKSRTAKSRQQTPLKSADPAQRSTAAVQPKVEQKIVQYAEELGRIVGTIRGRAESWTGERERMIKKLSTLVGEAQNLLTDLGHRAEHEVKRLASVRLGSRANDAGVKTRRKGGKIPKRIAGGPDRKTHTLPATTRKKMESRRKNREDVA